MIGVFVLLAAAAVPAEEELVIRETTPLPVVVLAPNGTAVMSSSELIRALGAKLEAGTSLEAEPIDEALVADCAGELACMVEKLRESFDGAAWLLVISCLSKQEKSDRLSMILVDAKRALDEYARAPKSDPDWRAGVEAAVNERAILARTRPGEVSSAPEVELLLARAIDEELRGAFEAAEVWRPFGEIELSGVGPGFLIELDGATVGTTRAERTRIKRVMRGPRVLSLLHPDHAAIAATVVVEAGRRAQFSARPIPLGRPASTVLRDATLYGGAGVALAGAAIAVFALVRHDGDAVVYCLGAGCESASQFERAAYEPQPTPRFAGSPNASGPALAPLGYAMITTGAIWALGVALFGEDREVPWPELAIGLAAGALAYGLSVSLDGATAFDP